MVDKSYLKRVLGAFIVFALIVSVLVMAIELIGLARFSNQPDKCVMYDLVGQATMKDSAVNGIAYADNHYVVWTEDRTFSQIEQTDRHEYCHVLVDNRPEHFCGDLE